MSRVVVTALGVGGQYKSNKEDVQQQLIVGLSTASSNMVSSWGMSGKFTCLVCRRFQVQSPPTPFKVPPMEGDGKNCRLMNSRKTTATKMTIHGPIQYKAGSHILLR